MSSDPVAEPMTLARACPADWDALSGSSQARACTLCRQTLFDTTAMSDADRAAFEAELAGGSGRARLFLRRDGTVMKRPCPAVHRVARKRLRLAALTLLVVGLLGEGALFHRLDVQVRERDDIERWCGCAVTSDRMLEHLKYMRRHEADAPARPLLQRPPHLEPNALDLLLPASPGSSPAWLKYEY